MNKSAVNPGRASSAPPLTPARAETAKRMQALGSFSLPKDVEENVISYLEHKDAAENDFDKALDFFLDLSSDFGVGDDRR